jgi:hypothetical protein|tara:strand:- start:1058 stop:1336 length:279 start_codon:yes stop_codon:yes gene_type:complete
LVQKPPLGKVYNRAYGTLPPSKTSSPGEGLTSIEGHLIKRILRLATAVGSTAAIPGPLLELALVFLYRGFVMADATQIGKDAGFGYRALETT